MEVTLSELQNMFVNGKITEQEADEKISHFYIKDTDDYKTPKTLLKGHYKSYRDENGQFKSEFVTETEHPNRFTDCKEAQEWCWHYNKDYMSRRPYEVIVVFKR